MPSDFPDASAAPSPLIAGPVALLIGVGIALLLRLAVPGPSVLTAPEFDALASGAMLAESLAQEGDASIAVRLQDGFAGLTETPVADTLRDGRAWRRAVATPPGPRWVAGLGIVLAPEGTNLDRARWGSALALGLAVIMLAHAVGWWGGGCSVGRGVIAGALLLAAPGMIDAGAAAGYGAAAALAMALHLVMVRRAIDQGPGGFWGVGLTLGFVLAVHPLTITLIIPLFIAWVIRHRPAGPPPTTRGALRLPVAPLSLFATPIWGVISLVAIWPALWSETGRQVGAWFMHPGWQKTPPHSVHGVLFDQGGDRAPQAWSALVQWVGHTPILLLAAWALGVWVAARRGRQGAWYPIVALVTLIGVGGLDGGLWGARLDLLPLLQVLTAITAAQGLSWAFKRLTRWASRVALLGVFVAVPLVMAVAQIAPWGVAGTGAELRLPLPVAWLTEMAEELPAGRVHIAADGTGWVHALRQARVEAEIDLRWSGPNEADWVIVIGQPMLADRAANAASVSGLTPVKVGRPAGVPMALYRIEERSPKPEGGGRDG